MKGYCSLCGTHDDLAARVGSTIGKVRLCAKCLERVAPGSKVGTYADHLDLAFEQSVMLEDPGNPKHTREKVNAARTTEIAMKKQRAEEAKRGRAAPPKS